MTDRMSRGPKNKTYSIDIAGLSLKLRTTHNEDTVNELVSFVNDKIKRAVPSNKTGSGPTGSGKTGSVHTATVLACLNIAEELFFLKKKALLEIEEVEQKAQRILSHLDHSRQTKTGIEN